MPMCNRYDTDGLLPKAYSPVPMPIAYCLLLISYCLLHIACCLLLTACCLLCIVCSTSIQGARIRQDEGGTLSNGLLCHQCFPEALDTLSWQIEAALGKIARAI